MHPGLPRLDIEETSDGSASGPHQAYAPCHVADAFFCEEFAGHVISAELDEDFAWDHFNLYEEAELGDLALFEVAEDSILPEWEEAEFLGCYEPM